MTTEQREKAIGILASLIKHPMIKEAHIADMLFSDNTSSNRSRFNHRMKGHYKWKDDELRRILTIFENFADKIDAARDAVADISEMRADYEEELAKLQPIVESAEEVKEEPAEIVAEEPQA